MSATIYIGLVTGLIVIGCQTQTSLKATPGINYTNIQALNNMGASKLAALVKDTLSERQSKVNFLRTVAVTGTRYHWTHSSNGALWESLFRPQRRDSAKDVLRAFVDISKEILTTMASTRIAPKERSNGVFALGLGYSRCNAYLLNAPVPRRRELTDILSTSMKEFAPMAIKQNNFDKEVREIRKQLDRFEEMCPTD